MPERWNPGRVWGHRLCLSRSYLVALLALRMLCVAVSGAGADSTLVLAEVSEPAFVEPQSPPRPTLVVPVDTTVSDGLHIAGSPRLVMSPSIQGKAHLEPVQRVSRVGKGEHSLFPCGGGACPRALWLHPVTFCW